jgi:hypothetical protein
MSKSLVEIDRKFIEERSLQTMEELELILRTDPEIIYLMPIEEVKKELSYLGASPVSNLKEKISRIRSSNPCEDDPADFSIEGNLVGRMKPIAQYKVKARFKYSEPTRLRIAYEPEPDE